MQPHTVRGCGCPSAHLRRHAASPARGTQSNGTPTLIKPKLGPPLPVTRDATSQAPSRLSGIRSRHCRGGVTGLNTLTAWSHSMS